MSTENPLVSIVTACYNSENYISDTINSILDQTYQHWELLLVDDCSIDKTVRIVKKFKESDNRIKIFELTENLGAAAARNKAISESKGRFIAFLDSDDKWLPQKLEKQIKFMLANKYSFTHTSYEFIDKWGNSTHQTVKSINVLSYNDMLYSNKIGCLTAVYDQNRLGKMYMPLMRKRQDYGLWLSILKTGEKAYGFPVVLSQYRLTSNSMSSNKISLIKWNWKLFREVERLSFVKSVYYLACNIALKLKSKY